MFDRASRKRKAMQTESKREPDVMGDQAFTGAQDVTQAGFLQETQVMDI